MRSTCEVVRVFAANLKSVLIAVKSLRSREKRSMSATSTILQTAKKSSLEITDDISNPLSLKQKSQGCEFMKTKKEI